MSTKIPSKIASINNGLKYEKLTDLSSEITKQLNINKINIVFFKQKWFIRANQNNFLKILKSKIKDVSMGHGCKKPDESYIDVNKNIIFIIEKKFQTVNGSVCEKIQTPDFKIWQYSRMLPDFKIVYMYSLSHWFRENCKAEIEYLKYKNIPFFWGDDINYKKNIVSYICDYERPE